MQDKSHSTYKPNKTLTTTKMENANEKSKLCYELQQISMLVILLYDVLTEEDLGKCKQLKLESLASCVMSKMKLVLNEIEA